MTINRRSRGEAVGAKALFVKVTPESFDMVDRLAPQLAVSKAELVEEILRYVSTTLDSQSVPTWWPRPLPDRGELPHSEELLTA